MRVRGLVALGMVAVLVATLAGGGLAQSAPAAQGGNPIRLRAVTFNPGAGQGPVTPLNMTRRVEPMTEGYYIVQAPGPITEEWKAALSAAGAELLDYIPDYAFKVRMNRNTALQLRALPEVAYVGLFHPYYAVSPEIAAGPQVVSLRVERGGNRAEVEAAVAAAGAALLGEHSGHLIIGADRAQINRIAQAADVAWVEPYVLNEKHDEYARTIIGVPMATAPTGTGGSYDGSSQIAAVADTGIGGGTAATAHPDIPPARVVAVQNFPGVSDTCFQTIVNDGAVDVASGHGSHVAGSVLSDGGISGEGLGIAPAARLVFQATENYVIVSNFCRTFYGYLDDYYLTGLNNLYDLFQQAYTAGARIHANSWGASVAGDYTANSATADDFIWDNKDFTITFSAGNSGADSNADGVVDNDSIGAPATAKNVITIGASENDRQGNYQCDTGLTYTSRDTSYQNGQTCSSMGGINLLGTAGQRWGFTAPPISTDLSGGNAAQMAAFSSRGPTDDNRIKPDVVAPGTWILSGYSSEFQEGYDAAVNPRNNAYQSDGWGMPRSATYKYFGGTSMSNPIAAGAATVVRDFYQKAHGFGASAALVKATLINSAVDMLDENNDGANDNDFPIPNVHEGWGRINLGSAVDGSALFVDRTTGIGTGASVTYNATVAGGAPLKVTVVWSDFASTATAAINLVNNLELTLTSPTGTVYRGNVFSGGWSATGGSADSRNNVENVYVQNAAAGTWTVQVSGFNVPQGPQPFAIVVDGASALNETTPPPPSATGLLSPSANAAVTSGSGDNNGFQTSPANAYANDGLFAVDTNSGSGTQTSCTSNRKDRHVYRDYNVSGVSGTVTGISVRLDARADSTTGAPFMCVQLSWDGGVTWTAVKTTSTLTNAEATYTLGGASDTWGRTWSTSELSNSSFRVRITNVASSTARDFSLDWVAVQVHYQP